MATLNPFDLLGVDAEDPSQIAVALPKKVEKAAPVLPPKAAKLQSKQAPPSQAVRESRNAPSGGRGGAGGRGPPRGSFNPGGNRPYDQKDGPKDGGFRGYRESGGRGGHVGGFADGKTGDVEQRPKRVYDRHSRTGRSNDVKREGGGRGNWGTPEDDIPPPTEEPTAEVEKSPVAENEGGEDDTTDAKKDSPAAEQEEKEPEDKEMTLEEYEKILEEKKKALQATKVEERKVDTKGEALIPRLHSLYKIHFIDSMATVSSASPWPSDSTSALDSNCTVPSHHRDRGDETEPLDSFSSMSLNSEEITHNSDRIPESQTPANPPPSLLHLSFNQDHACFAVGTDRGFRILNCDPFREIFRRDFDRGGGVAVVEMLFRCNILALVGGGPDPQYPPNKVMIWDDHQSRCIGELSFRSDVRSVRLRRDRIIVVLEQKIFVYNFADLKLMHQIETIANPKGLCAVSQGAGSMVLVCPGLQKGQVRIEHYASKRTKFVMAHDSRIACFALTQDGHLLATASSKGTLVRIFNTVDGTLRQEVRRGADRAEIYSLAFSSNAQWLAVSSDKGTVHVFGLKGNSGAQVKDTPRIASDLTRTSSSPSSSLSLFKGVLPKYFSSEWSVAQFRLVEGTQYVVAFGHQKNTVVILGMDGSFYRCQFDPVNGGEMSQLEYHNCLKPPVF